MSGNVQAPNFLSGRQSRGIAQRSIQGIGGSQPPHISIESNVFTLVDGAGNRRPLTVEMIDPHDGQRKLFQAPYLDCVIVDANTHLSKVYYVGDYFPDSNEGPACFSDNGVGASSQAINPQSLNCQLCQWNAWGSAISKLSGKGVQACRTYRKIAVLIPGDPILYQLRVPPTSLSRKVTSENPAMGLKEYSASVNSYSLGKRQADLLDVITRIEFIPGSTQGQIKFYSPGFITEQIAAEIDELATEEKTLALVGGTDTVRTIPIPVLAAPQQSTVVQPAAAAQLSPYSQTGNSVSLQIDQTLRRPRRTKAEMEAERNARQSSQKTQPMQTALQPTQPLPMPPSAPVYPSTPAQQSITLPQQNFGMVSNPPLPDSKMMETIKLAFDLPKKG